MAAKSLSITGQRMALDTVLRVVLPGTQAVSAGERELLIAHVTAAQTTLAWLEKNEIRVKSALEMYDAARVEAPNG